MPQADVECQRDKMIVTFLKRTNPSLRKETIVTGEDVPSTCKLTMSEDSTRIKVTMPYDQCARLSVSYSRRLSRAVRVGELFTFVYMLFLSVNYSRRFFRTFFHVLCVSVSYNVCLHAVRVGELFTAFFRTFFTCCACR